MHKDLSEQLLRELLKNSKRSDRELAKILGVSQPTVTRTRSRLEREGIIQDYTIIPDLRKMGFELLGINFAKIRPEILSSDMREKAEEFIGGFPGTIFASSGEGMGFNAVSIAVYRNYTEFQKRVNQFRAEWKDVVENIQSFVVAIGEREYKRLSLTYLKDVPP